MNIDLKDNVRHYALSTLFNRAQEIKEATLGPENGLSGMGVCAREAGRLEEAESLFDRLKVEQPGELVDVLYSRTNVELSS